MVARTIQTSFAAGELSPALFARVDLDKYKVGAALLRNMFVDYRGGAATRPGTRFIGACKAVSGQPRLIPFIVSTDATYMLEFGQEYIRFISNGAYLMSMGAPYEITSPYAAADLPLLKYTQSADVLTLTHPSYPVYNLTRTGSTTFALNQDIIAPVQQPPTNLAGVISYTPNTDSAYGYVVTAVSLNGQEESLPTLPEFVEGIPLGSQNSAAATLTWTASTTATAYYNIYRVGVFRARGTSTGFAMPPPTFYGYIGQSLATTFVDNNISADFTRVPPLFQDPFTPGQVQNISVTGGGSGYTTGYIIPLEFTGGGAGATLPTAYGVIQPTSPDVPPGANTVVGVVLLTPGKNITAPLTISDSNGTAVYAATYGPTSGTYPACVGYFQQRRTFGGTDNFPESLVFSEPGVYDNFNTTPVSNAEDGITVSLASLQVNAIKSLTAMSTGLVVLTTGAGFLVSGGNQQAAITPSNVVALPQASSGANDMPALKINNNILYAQNRGFVIRDLAFNFYTQSYIGTDRSILASHLFLNYTGSEWTYAEEPWRIVPTIRNDGTLLMFTYVLDQEVFAWTHYDTNGYFRSVASVPEGQTNAVYVIVQRLVGGVYVYYTERFDDRLWTQPWNSWCLDAALALGETAPAATLFPGAGTALANAAIVGTEVEFKTDAAVFAGTATDVGKVIWAGTGMAIVTAAVSTAAVIATIQQPFALVSNDPNFTPVFYASGDWTYDTPVTQVSGLDHLDGLTVQAVVDGTPQPPVVCVAGTVAFPPGVTGTKVVAGLPFQCQLQTLRLDVGEPTIQGKRKNLAAVTVRFDASIVSSVKCGDTFDHLTTFSYPFSYLPFTPPTPFYTGDHREPIFTDWSTDGQLCVQVDDPVPVTVLGLIPEVVLGDTG